MSEVYVLWVRHGEACQNVAFISSYKIDFKYRLKNRMMKAPLNTLKGFHQGLNIGTQLNEWYQKDGKKLVGPKVKIYTSFLTRSILTAKLLSNSFKKQVKKIEPICYVSEGTKIYDITKESANRYPYKKYLCYVAALNNIFNDYGSKIVISDQGCDQKALCSKMLTEKCVKCKSQCCLCRKKGLCKLDNKCDYQNFKNIHLGKTLKPKVLNIVVSHGRYISKYLNLNLKSKPKNTQSYLVKYTKNGDEWDQKVLDIDFMPKNLSKYEYPKNIEEKYLNCTYSYKKDIKTKCK